MLVRFILTVAGLLAVLLVGREAVNFDLVEGMIGIALIATLVAAMVAVARLGRTRRDADSRGDAGLMRKRRGGSP